VSLLQQFHKTLTARLDIRPRLPPVAVRFKQNNRQIYRQLVVLENMPNGTGNSPVGQDFAMGCPNS